MRESLRWAVACVALSTSIVAARAADTLQFTSIAHDAKTDRVIYTEQYDVKGDNGRWISGTTRYLSPTGQPVAERKFDFSTDRYIPVFTLDQTSPEYHEGISRIDKDKVELFNALDGDRQTGSVDRVKDMAADSGAQGYVVDHLDTLQKGGTLRFTLAVAGKTDSYRLRATKIGDSVIEGRKGIRVRVELDSVVRVVLSPLELTIDPLTKQLLEYSGVSNLKDPATKKSYTARIVYTYK